MLAVGDSQRTIAKKMGCAQQSVSYLKQQNAALIEVQQQKFINAIPTAVDTAIELMKDYNDKEVRKKLSYAEMNHAHVHTMETLRSAGIYQSSSTPQIIENMTIHQDHRQLNITVASKEDIYDEVMKLVGSV